MAVAFQRSRAGSLAFAACALGSVAVVVYLISHGQTTIAVGFAILPLLAWVLAHPSPLLVVLGLSIPAFMSIAGGSGGFHVAASDLVLAVLTGSILLEATLQRSMPVVKTLRPVAWAVGPYAIYIILLLPFHLSVSEIAQSLQRYELFLIALLVGAYAALRGEHMRLLGGYIISSTVLAIIWPLDHLGLQKNPVGQLFANALLLMVAIPQLRRLLVAAVILVPALLYTESRGAIAATAIGLAVIVVFQGLNARSLFMRVVPLVLLLVGAFALMPASLRARVTTFTPGTNTPAAYSLHIRQQFSRDAKRLAREHPWTGIGVGNYAAADHSPTAPTSDPHEVVYLEAAEGGWGFAGAFVVLIVGTFFVLLRLGRRSPVVTAAAAVVLGTFVHGLVDVYWVRGTPVLGWLLVGMACTTVVSRGPATA